MDYGNDRNVQRPVGVPSQAPAPLNDGFDTLHGDGKKVHEGSNLQIDH